MKFQVIGLLAGVALLAGACADTRLVENVSGMTPVQQGFTAHLHEQYVALSRAEFAEGDIYDGGIFARRGEASAKGEVVEPDSLWDRSFTEANRVQVHQQRGRLMYALDSGGREQFPELASTAQSQFDCWVQELEENNQPDDIRRCRDGYETAMKALEDALKPAPMATTPAPAPAPAPEVVRNFLVFFDFDSANLTESAREIIEAAYNASEQGSVATIEATGHADRAGPDGYNLRLSERRAAAVRAELIRLGAAAGEVVTLARGEREPLVETGDGVREPQNRRVEIILK
ncbi:MAG: OmpA family protein [Alphaproteobacteria bacterium]